MPVRSRAGTPRPPNMPSTPPPDCSHFRHRPAASRDMEEERRRERSAGAGGRGREGEGGKEEREEEVGEEEGKVGAGPSSPSLSLPDTMLDTHVLCKQATTE